MRLHMRPVLHTQKHGWRLRCAASLLRFARHPCFCVCSTWPHVQPGQKLDLAYTDTLAFKKSLPAHVYVRARRRSLPVVPQRRRRAADVVGQREPEVRLRDEARDKKVVRRVVRGEGELPS